MWDCNPEALTQVRAPSGDEVGRVSLESLQYDTPEAEYVKGIASQRWKLSNAWVPGLLINIPEV